MLPEPGIYYFPWEVSAGQVPDGDTLRTFGRLYSYDMTKSRVTLMAQHRSDQHPILVCTKLVEPFQAQEETCSTICISKRRFPQAEGRKELTGIIIMEAAW
ncbi:CST complex subunit TEN1 isoform X2 [Balaenoptera ricei]|uniref:CST complex subunit TEN1 isoform X2 n=1 Tax=Balaenoptera ricei TaxID=2746895 RepID=UPI0028BD650B|nr:CST complex subunit TEN1 isoform X2 [Balaenoptera ricei]